MLSHDTALALLAAQRMISQTRNTNTISAPKLQGLPNSKTTENTRGPQSLVLLSIKKNTTKSMRINVLQSNMNSRHHLFLWANVTRHCASLFFRVLARLCMYCKHPSRTNFISLYTRKQTPNNCHNNWHLHETTASLVRIQPQVLITVFFRHNTAWRWPEKLTWKHTCQADLQTLRGSISTATCTFQRKTDHARRN